jgi:solute carrier family 25 protein 39/40
MVEAERAENSWIASETSPSSSPVVIESSDFSITDGMRDVSGFGIASRPQLDKGLSENNIGFTERVFSAAGAAVLSAVTLNPLDVVKTRLQAQAAGMSYSHPLSNSIGRMAFFGPNMMFADLRCSPSCARAGVEGTVSICPPDCFQYKGTFDVFTKIIRQEGLGRLWRGTNAGLALAVPMVGIYLPFYDMFRNRLEELSREKAPAMTFCVPTVAGSLARSLACTVCYPIDLARTRMQAFKEAKAGVKPPGVFKTLVGVFSEVRTANNLESSCKLLLPSSQATEVTINIPNL